MCFVLFILVVGFVVFIVVFVFVEDVLFIGDDSCEGMFMLG